MVGDAKQAEIRVAVYPRTNPHLRDPRKVLLQQSKVYAVLQGQLDDVVVTFEWDRQVAL